MNTIHVWILVKPGEWRDFIFTLPSPEICNIVKIGLSSIYPSFPEEGYIEIIYAVGGGIGMMFDGCY